MRNSGWSAKGRKGKVGQEKKESENGEERADRVQKEMADWVDLVLLQMLAKHEKINKDRTHGLINLFKEERKSSLIFGGNRILINNFFYLFLSFLNFPTLHLKRVYLTP